MLCCLAYNSKKSKKINVGDKINVYEKKKKIKTVVVGKPTSVKSFN